MDLPKIIDNDRILLLDVFKKLSANQSNLSIATGYWDLEAMKLVIEELEKFKKIRLLIGREPIIARYNLQKLDKDFPEKDFKYDLEQIRPESELREVASKIIQFIRENKLEVRIYRKNFLHAKTYIFGDFESTQASGVIGSSNFTKNGLIGNSELNSLESDHRIVTYKPVSAAQENGHLSWFEKYWNDEQTEIWDGTFTKILEESPMGNVFFSPYETYIKTLYEIYKDEIEVSDINSQDNFHGKKLFDFQYKNVQAILRKLKKFNVAMLSDSVGLGKTTTSIEVIKQYLNDPNGKKRVEIICPASIQEQWEKELTIQGIFGRTPISLQNKSEIDSKMELDSIASVSLFVIDESHNLRQSNGKRFQQLLDWIRNNPNSHVLLVTATPINNNLVDLSNQILLGLGGKADAFKITVTGENKQTQQITFYAAIENLRKKIQQDLTREGKVDFEKIKETMIPIIRNFVVRRTRQGITSEYGGLIIDGVFQKFPAVKPEILKYQFDPKSIEEIKKIKSEILNLDKIYSIDPNKIVDNSKNLSHPVRQITNIEFSQETTNEIESPIFYLFQLILLLGFVPYRWKMYQKNFYGKSRKQINELSITSIERKKLLLQISIFGILRTVYLKRMESSVEALKISIENYESKLDFFKKGIEKGQIFSVSDLENYIENVDDDTLSEDFFDDNAFQENIDDKSYNLKALLEDINTEKEILKIIKLQLKIINCDDVKLKVLLETMEKIHQVSPSQKILIFSYFSDTINYLSNNVYKKSKIFDDTNVGFVSSKTKSDAEKLASLFSPKSKKYELKSNESEIKYLFSTDILSEGQNLQDAGILINYDLHWNPVRMIQRNGRVNRLGSQFNEVTIFNMRPEVKLDTYLKLIQRLQGKIDMIKNTIGTDSPVLDEPENPIEFSDSIQEIYSDNLEKRLKAISDAEKAADYLLAEDEFVIDLKKFHNDESVELEYKKSIYEIPYGKWAKYPKLNFAGKDRPKMIALAKLSTEKEAIVFHQFVEVNSDKMQIKAVNQLQALEWLKTEPSDNIRSRDNAIFERNLIKELIEKNVLVFTEEPEMGALIGQENQVLKLLYLAQHSQESIDLVRKAFKSTNIFFKQDITKIKRKIMQKFNKNENYNNDLMEIVQMATKINNHSGSTKNTTFDKSNLVMVYVNEN